MKKFWLFVFGLIFFFTSSAIAQDKVVVIPLFSDEGTSSTPPAPVAKTGQTESYDFGDDGYLEKGVDSPSSRFTDNDNGTVTDNLTGLVWMKDANCQYFYIGDNTGQNNRPWENALSSCNTLVSGYCSLTDDSTIFTWRLPNLNELQSLIDISQWSPALPLGHPFSGVNTLYWTSSAYSYDTDWDRWGVHFFSGTADTFVLATDYYVWCVRDGN